MGETSKAPAPLPNIDSTDGSGLEAVLAQAKAPVSFDEEGHVHSEGKVPLFIDSDGHGYSVLRTYFGGDLTDLVFAKENWLQKVMFAVQMGAPVLIPIECLVDVPDDILMPLLDKQRIIRQGRSTLILKIGGEEIDYDAKVQILFYASSAECEGLHDLTSKVAQHLIFVDCVQEFKVFKVVDHRPLVLQVVMVADSESEEPVNLSVLCHNLAGEQMCTLRVPASTTKVRDLRVLAARRLTRPSFALTLTFSEALGEMPQDDANVSELWFRGGAVSRD